MKNIVKIFSVLMMIVGTFAFGQTGGCTPQLDFPFPKKTKDKIEYDYSRLSQRFQGDESCQAITMRYIIDFDKLLTNSTVPTEEEMNTVKNLVDKSRDNKTIQFVRETAQKSNSYDEFIKILNERIYTTKDVQEFQILVMTSYQMQIINYENATLSNQTTAKDGWWDKWGRCAAGIVGGAGLGALEGSAVPAVGTVIGGIAGGLLGASQAC